ncbi:MAG: methyltransferase domain-containing protein [Ignavibacteriota bacterium]
MLLVSIGAIAISLIVSCYVYDFSDLYKLKWLDKLQILRTGKLMNINAGFDETSSLLKNKYPSTELMVFDFYDSEKHTEPSIRRARKAYPAFLNTRQCTTTYLPLEENSVDNIFLIFSAHEIRNDNERIGFFKEMSRVLKPSGEIVVTEHLRDTPNFIAYTLGFFHFHTNATWLKTFHSAELGVVRKIKITPFISTFVLKKL